MFVSIIPHWSMVKRFTCKTSYKSDSSNNKKLYFFSSEGYSIAREMTANTSIESSDVQLMIGIAFPLQGTSVGIAHFHSSTKFFLSFITFYIHYSIQL